MQPTDTCKYGAIPVRTGWTYLCCQRQKASNKQTFTLVPLKYSK